MKQKMNNITGKENKPKNTFIVNKYTVPITGNETPVTSVIIIAVAFNAIDNDSFIIVPSTGFEPV